MTERMQSRAKTLAAKAGFGRKRMLALAGEIVDRPVNDLAQLTGLETSKYMLLLEVLAMTFEEAEQTLKVVKAFQSECRKRAASRTGRRVLEMPRRVVNG